MIMCDIIIWIFPPHNLHLFAEQCVHVLFSLDGLIKKEKTRKKEKDVCKAGYNYSFTELLTLSLNQILSGLKAFIECITALVFTSYTSGVIIL